MRRQLQRAVRLFDVACTVLYIECRVSCKVLCGGGQGAGGRCVRVQTVYVNT